MKNIFSLTILALLCATAFSQADTTAIFHKADSLNTLGDTFYDAQKYNEAFELYNQAAEMTKDVEKGNNIHYATSLYNIAWVYSSIGNYENALEYFIQTAEIQKVILGAEHPKYAKTLNGIGGTYSYIDDQQNALRYYSQALEIRKKVLGEGHPDYAISLYGIASVYENMGDYKNALIYGQKAMEVFKEVFGEDHPNYAEVLSGVGLAYNGLGEYKIALEYFFKSMELTKKIYGNEHSKYAASFNNIVISYIKMGDWDNALKYQLLAIELNKRFSDEKLLAASLNNAGNIYSDLGDLQNAMTFYTQAMEIYKKIYGENHPKYAYSLTNIGIIYSDIGDFQNALKCQHQAMEIFKNIYGEEHVGVASLINNIGNTYSYMGDWDNALKCFLRTVEIQRKILGEDHPDCAASLNNVGAAYKGMEDYENAMKYYLKSMELRKKFYGDDHPAYAASLNNIGSLYYSLDDYQNALKYHLQAMEIREKIWEGKNYYYAESLNNIGVVYNSMGDYQSALKYLIRSAEITKEAYGELNSDNTKSLGNIINTAIAYYGMGDYHNAIKTTKHATDIYKNNLIRNFSYMTAHEREAYRNENGGYLRLNIKYLYHASDDTLGTKTSYDTELITKGLLLASEISIANTIMESGDTALIAEYENMKTLHLQLNKELEKPITERIYNCDSLENEIQKTERHMMESCKEFGDVTHFIKIDWKEVQNSLKANDVAIEFSGFTEEDTTKYVALVLTKDMEAPVCVPLFEQSEMQKHLRNIYDTPEMYDLIWKPLEKYFPENPRIFFAPSGMLHRIAVEYAPVGNGKTISDKYEIYRVSSTRFLAMDYKQKPMKNSVLYGGVFYDSDTTTMKFESERFTTRSAEVNSFSDLNKGESRSPLLYLQGTKNEVEDIAAKMKKKKISTILYEGSQANEESFKALSGSDISVLHIATHGFFLPTDEKMSGDQSLIQSGLLLSGANYAWQNKPLPEGIEDGILTAKEISFMDLRKTDLVVLSACQTALGEITGEGVFGLQRGFKKAGVHTIIMSLWSVDDKATQLMMTEFYSNLIKGMTKREAFLKAQRTLKTTAGFENPRFWAAFIMLDGNEK